MAASRHSQLCLSVHRSPGHCQLIQSESGNKYSVLQYTAVKMRVASAPSYTLLLVTHTELTQSDSTRPQYLAQKVASQAAEHTSTAQGSPSKIQTTQETGKAPIHNNQVCCTGNFAAPGHMSSPHLALSRRRASASGASQQSLRTLQAVADANLQQLVDGDR
jgi:hypothetical protein